VARLSSHSISSSRHHNTIAGGQPLRRLLLQSKRLARPSTSCMHAAAAATTPLCSTPQPEAFRPTPLRRIGGGRPPRAAQADPLDVGATAHRHNKAQEDGNGSGCRTRGGGLNNNQPIVIAALLSLDATSRRGELSVPKVGRQSQVHL